MNNKRKMKKKKEVPGTVGRVCDASYGETHRRVASPRVPGIQRSIAITPCFSKTKPQKILRWLFKSKSSLFTVLETENSTVRVNQIWCEISALSLDK
jgi:hypothetical protein